MTSYTGTVYPNSTISAAGTLSTGGAGAGYDDRLADDDDATYVDLAGSPTAGELYIGFGTLTLGTDVIQSVHVRVRGQDAAGGGFLSQLTVELWTGTERLQQTVVALSALDYYETAWVARALTQAEIDGLFVVIRMPQGSGNTARVMNLNVDFIQVEQPVTTVLEPTGTVTATTTPTARWIHEPQGDVGGPQSQFEIKVFSAAQYGAGAFNPDNSPATFASGVQVGSLNFYPIGPLADATTYRTYVRAAQMVNGQPQWAAWDYEAFTTDFDLPVIDSVLVGPDPANGRMVIVIDQDPTAPEWDLLAVERSFDGDVDGSGTWSFVRGAGTSGLVPEAGDPWILYDYETGNGQLTLYRARSTSTDFVGEWTYAAAPEAWTSDDAWLKVPTDPNLNRVLKVTHMPGPTRPLRRGVHEIIGSPTPVVTTDVRSSRRGDLIVITDTPTEADDLLAIVGVDVTLLQVPASQGGAFEMYLVVTDVDEDRLARSADGHARLERLWTLPFVEVARPVDTGITAVVGVAEIALPLTWDEAALFTWDELEAAFTDWDALLA